MKTRSWSRNIRCQIDAFCTSTSAAVCLNLDEEKHALIVWTELNKLVRRLKLSQQAVATAQVYIRRVYTKIEIRRTNPNLVIVTALYLACKMEESPQHIRMILGEARQAWQGKHQTHHGHGDERWLTIHRHHTSGHLQARRV